MSWFQADCRRNRHASELVAKNTSGGRNEVQSHLFIHTPFVSWHRYYYCCFSRFFIQIQEWESYDAVFCNYFSFGVDAVAANAFHEHRKQYPQLFTSRCR